MARLARQFHDFDLAEEAVQGAVVEALETWRRDGAPDNPAAWLQTAARHNALDLVRRRTRQDALAHRAPEVRRTTARSATDDRLALLFACCHPALAPEARLALTLRAVVGMTTPQIARAFLVNERTLAQRIVRAKRKIVAAGIALTVPADDVLAERLADVLAVVALMYNEGFVSSDGPTQDRDLAGDAVWLAGVVATSLPREAEAWGLAALLTFQHARAAARFSAAGDLVLLPDQDRSLWDPDAIAAGDRCWSARPRPARSGALPAAGGDRRLPRDQPVVGADRLAPDRHPLRPAGPSRPLARRPPQPGRGVLASGPRARRRMRSPTSTPWPNPSTATTCSTRPGPSC